MERISKSILINADLCLIWPTLMDTDNAKLLAVAFSEGIATETDWSEGSAFYWKDKEGNIGATGIVESNKKGDYFLKVKYNAEENNSLEISADPYCETYKLVGNNYRFILQIEAGPIDESEAEKHAGMWDNALSMLKKISEQKDF